MMNFNYTGEQPKGGFGGVGGVGGGKSAYVKSKVEEREEELKANIEKARKFKQVRSAN